MRSELVDVPRRRLLDHSKLAAGVSLPILPSARHFLFEGCCLSHFFQSIRSPMDSSSRRWEGQRYGCLLTSFDCCSRDPSACIILVAMTSGFGAGGGEGTQRPPSCRLVNWAAGITDEDTKANSLGSWCRPTQCSSGFGWATSS